MTGFTVLLLLAAPDYSIFFLSTSIFFAQDNLSNTSR
jgi:hypothetical protein